MDILCRVHALLGRNMVHALDDVSDPFEVEGLKRMGRLELPDEDTAALATCLEELMLHLRHHQVLETELARYAESDEDVRLLMTIHEMNLFTAVPTKRPTAIKARYLKFLKKGAAQKAEVAAAKKMACVV